MREDSTPFAYQSYSDGGDIRVNTHDAVAESNYWTDFYKTNDFQEGSSFCEFLKNNTEMPNIVIDIGCGQGRDSLSFAESGKTVIGLDRSKEGVLHANNHASQEGMASKVHFAVCDVSNNEQIRSVLEATQETAGNEPVCYYMRFFLHSIPEDAQETLMTAIANAAKSGDVFAAEFRTDKDMSQPKEFGDTHYRRYQSAEEFSHQLKEKFGWTNVMHEIESQGLSVYKDEDPVLYRVIATR